jgi:hypothetical protein
MEVGAIYDVQKEGTSEGAYRGWETRRDGPRAAPFVEARRKIGSMVEEANEEFKREVALHLKGIPSDYAGMTRRDRENRAEGLRLVRDAVERLRGAEVAEADRGTLARMIDYAEREAPIISERDKGDRRWHEEFDAFLAEAEEVASRAKEPEGMEKGEVVVWEPSRHPRGEGGRFAQAEARDPEERRRLVESAASEAARRVIDSMGRDANRVIYDTVSEFGLSGNDAAEAFQMADRRLRKERELDVLRKATGDLLSKVEFEEDEHPRDPAGRFASRGEGVAPRADAVSKEEIDRVFDGRAKNPSTPDEQSRLHQEIEASADRASRMSQEDHISGVPERMTKVSERAEAVVMSLGRRIMEEGAANWKEFVFAVENGSGDVVGMREGDKESASCVGIYGGMDRDRGYTFVHNHPTSNSFSDVDVIIFTRIPQFTRAVVVSGMWTYILEKPPGWNFRKVWGVDDARAEYLRQSDVLTPKYKPPANPDGTRDDARDRVAWREQGHEVISNLAKLYGLSYRREKRA